ncbi:MAG: DUF751 family protein [Cyanobacteria bacterium J06597_1]
MAGKQERKLEDRFIENVSRYPLYIFSVMLGGLWVLVKPLVELYRRSKVAAVLVSLGFVAVLAFVVLTLKAMTGDLWLPTSLAS